VERDRVLVVKSEDMFASPDEARGVLDWLGIGPTDRPFPRGNEAVRHEEADQEVVAELGRHFEPHNRALEDLLGRPFWPQ
jgi:hypothetical protein